MDLFPGHDIYEGFCNYQATLLAEFDRLAEEYKFDIVDASEDAAAICARLKKKILQIIEPARVIAPAVKAADPFAESLAEKLFANLTMTRPSLPQ